METERSQQTITVVEYEDEDYQKDKKSREGRLFPFQKKVMLTVSMYIGFIVAGFGTALIGPTLPDLEVLTGSSTEEMSYVITARSLSNFIGAFSGGILIDKFNVWFLLTCGMLLAAPCFAVIPSFTSIVWVGLFTTLCGFFYGAVNSVTNKGLFQIWRDKNGPWMQALHCSFVVGMFLASVIARPFVSDENSRNQQILNKSVYTNSSASLGNMYNITYPGDNRTIKMEVELKYPYLIGGMLTVVSCIIFVISMLISSQPVIKSKVLLTHRAKTSEHYIKSQKGHANNSFRSFHRYQRLQLSILMFIFILSFCTAEVLYSIYLVTFIVQQLAINPKEAVVFSVEYFIVTVASRVVSIFLITKVKPVFLIFCGMCLTLFSAILFYLVNIHISIVWIATLFAAWGSATQLPTTLTWMSCYVEVKGYVGTLLLLSNATGRLLGPFLLGILFNKYGITSFLYVLTASVCLKFILFIIIILFLQYYWKNNNNKDTTMHEVEIIQTNET